MECMASVLIYLDETIPSIHLKAAQNILPQYRLKALWKDECGWNIDYYPLLFNTSLELQYIYQEERLAETC